MIDDQSQRRFTYVLDEATSILAVDDDAIQREFCSVYLSSPSTEITTAPSAEAGLALLDGQSFDMVLVETSPMNQANTQKSPDPSQTKADGRVAEMQKIRLHEDSTKFKTVF